MFDESKWPWEARMTRIKSQNSLYIIFSQKRIEFPNEDSRHSRLSKLLSAIYAYSRLFALIKEEAATSLTAPGTTRSYSM